MPVDLSSLTTRTPPKRGGGTTRTPRAPKQTPASARVEAVNGIFQLVQFGCVATGNHADAAAIGMHADNISTEIVKLADANESIARAIDFLLTAGPYAGLVTACLPLVMQVLANHGRLPETTPGITPPSLLKMQFELELRQQKAAMEQQLQDAQRHLQQMQAQEQANVNGQAA